MAKGIKKIELYEEVFGIWVFLYCDCDFNTFSNNIKKDLSVEIPEDGDESEMCGGVWSCYTSKGISFIMWIENSKDYKTLCHESIHLAFGVLHSRNVNVDFNNQEPLAYYTTFWITKLKEKLGGNSG